MNKEQLEHFLKDGYFTAVYKPVRTDDISSTLRYLESKKVIAYRNYEITPMIAGEFEGDYRFFILEHESHGWIPEQELTELTIQPNNYVEWELSRWSSNHQYRITVKTRKNAIANFGNYGRDCKLPVITSREYNTKMHDYVVDKLCNPPADKVEYRLFPDTKWTTIHSKIRKHEQANK